MNYKGITLLQIEYFFSVARYLNFTEAARNLYVSQPALSKHIAMLENEIGVQLFFRTKRDVRLTAAGMILLKEMGGIIELIENAIEKSKKLNLEEDSNISIGCLEAMETSTFLPVMIRKFREKYSSVNLVLERHSFKVLREKLINGTLDIIFTLSFEIDDSLGILSDIVYEGNAYIVMEASHPLANKSGLMLEDFKNENFIIISRDESPKGFDGIIGLCKKHGFSPKIVKSLPNAESLILCVESGLGVALLDSNIRLYNNPNLKGIKIEDNFISVTMAWKKENMNTAIPLFTNSVLSEVEL
ncbi:LysR family transcriptional regulator [Clostridium sp. PL3]|uniref:LysR family transcriptional regulator n=1 Tax=Clostridium thailandense TaxID=2794346 RepID=A0A949TW94_9CLOT|nr:LysR family transcriptional regulator [Clostridium thailandense]MBV7274721.1 LysR family transcriptional regulator [Clostridium thailandense]